MKYLKICGNILLVMFISNISYASSSDEIYADLINKGIAQDRCGNIDAAISTYTSAVTASPKPYEAYINRGILFTEQRSYHKAIDDLSKALDIRPESGILNTRGFCYLKTGDYELALKDLDRSINMNPSYMLAYRNRARVLIKIQQYERALPDIDKALSIKPQNSDTHILKTYCLIKLKKYKEALNSFKDFIRYAPAKYKPLIDNALKKIKERTGKDV